MEAFTGIPLHILPNVLSRPTNWNICYCLKIDILTIHCNDHSREALHWNTRKSTLLAAEWSCCFTKTRSQCSFSHHEIRRQGKFNDIPSVSTFYLFSSDVCWCSFRFCNDWHFLLKQTFLINSASFCFESSQVGHSGRLPVLLSANEGLCVCLKYESCVKYLVPIPGGIGLVDICILAGQLVPIQNDMYSENGNPDVGFLRNQSKVSSVKIIFWMLFDKTWWFLSVYLVSAVRHQRSWIREEKLLQLDQTGRKRKLILSKYRLHQ